MPYMPRLERKSWDHVYGAYEEWVIEEYERTMGPDIPTILTNYTFGMVKRKVGRAALAEFEDRPMVTGDPLHPGWTVLP